MTSGDVIAIVAVSLTAIIAIVGWVVNRFSAKDEKIKLLQQKCEILEAANQKLENQNLKLEVVGQLSAQFFKQLPPALRELNEESG